MIRKALLLLSLVATISFTGCTTTSTGQKVVDPAVLQGIAQSAASTASYIYLQSNPQDRDKFVLAQKSLQALIASGSGDVAGLQNALTTLPIKQLQGTQGAIIVANAVTVINIASKELTKLDKNQVASLYVLPIAQGLLDGLNQTLGN